MVRPMCSVVSVCIVEHVCEYIYIYIYDKVHLAEWDECLHG